MPIPDRLAQALADRYRIERELGTGGMATVYLAEDLKHDRRVAIKVLKPELAAVLGAERFVVEIKTTAALSHPHILPLFDSGEAGGFLYYVMPFIEGETIRDRLNRETQFSVDEAVRITREIADALDYAHRHGVIHRDIKPENILLHDGRAMVMDFGIALAVSAAAGGRMTETGLSLGTPHYMSPEQATADKAITGRSDIYSLASVCYEMLSAEPPHTGGTAQAIIMKIIAERAKPVSELRKSVPPHITAALEQALEKVPADRFDSARAFAEALGSAGFTYGTTAASFDAAGGGALRGNRAALAAMAVAAAALVVAAAGWMRTMPEAPFSRVDLDFGAVQVTQFDAALSPDGRMIAISGTRDGTSGIFLRRLDGDAEFRFVDGTASGIHPSFSPDNEWIVFRRSSDETLVKVRVGGGGAVTLVPAGALRPFNPDWGMNGRIAFTGPNGGGVVDASGGEVTPMPMGFGRKVSVLPDGSGLLSSNAGNLTLWEFDTDSFSVLLPGGGHPVYSPTGHLLYVGNDGGLFAVAFDLKRHRVTGAPVRVLERVAASIGTRGFALSASGLLLQHDAEGFVIGGGADRLLIVDAAGGVDTVRVPVARYNKPRFSPDGRRIAMEVLSPERNGQTDIYTTDLVTGTFTQLTFEGDNDEPAWSPDGEWLAYDVARGDGERLCVKPADNSAQERCLDATRHGGEMGLSEWLDDSTLLYAASTRDQGDEIFTVTLGGDSTPRSYLQTPFNEWFPRRSPDGSLIVFTSNETGSEQLWMRDYPVPKGRWNLSRAAAAAPRWSPDGRYVYFAKPGTPNDTLFRVRIERTPSIVVRDAEVVHTIDIRGVANWDLHPDGSRVLLTVSAGASAAGAGGGGDAPVDRHLLLQNWFSELRRLTASAR